MASRIHRAAQPALLYLVPFTLLPLLTMAYLKVHRCGGTAFGCHLFSEKSAGCLNPFIVSICGKKGKGCLYSAEKE